MPYIKPEDKKKYEPHLGGLRKMIEIEGILEELPEDVRMQTHSNDYTIPKGELTYLVYALGLSFFKKRDSYTNISTAISCLEDAAEELRRRHLNPYEDKKIRENGDVE